MNPVTKLNFVSRTGIWLQTYMHTTSANAVMLVWDSLRLAPINYAHGYGQGIPKVQWYMYTEAKMKVAITSVYRSQNEIATASFVFKHYQSR